jgi:ribosomal protein S18 acetylase RimI-like enzyme
VTGGEPAVELRPADPADRDFFARVYASTRAEELAPVPWTDEQKSAFVAQQFAAQSHHYGLHYADAAYNVIVVDGAPAGRLIVDRTDEALLIVDITLLPQFRGRGVGTRLLEPLLEEASAAGRFVRIHVEQTNPAMSLYRRLGFEPVREVGIYLEMRRSPQAKTAS